MTYVDFLRIYLEEKFLKKILRDKSFNVVKNSETDGYQRGLPLMLYKFFNKISSDSSI